MHHRRREALAEFLSSRVWKNSTFQAYGERAGDGEELKVVKVDTDENLLLCGMVPGPSGTYIFIRKARKAK